MASRDDKFSPHSHIPYGADGSGFYSDNAIGCCNVMLESAPLMLDAVKSASAKTGSAYTITDYGCADGGTSMPLLYACVQELRSRYGDELPVHVIYEDQPINDFKSLFLRLQGLIPGPKSYFLDFHNVYVTASGTNFYTQCLPPGSVHLGFSATAMHWLRDKPCDVTGALHHTMITVPEEAEKFKEQAARDWETVLLARAKELALGGRMILVQFAVDNEGHFVGTTKDTPVSMHHTMRDLWKGLADEGVITQEEFQRTTFVVYYRTVAEFRKPFDSKDSPVRQAGLSLVSIETKIVRCPFRKKWLKNGGNPKAHARWFVPTIRIWSNSTFISGLSDSRSAEEKAKIVDEFFTRYEDEIAKCPENHGQDFVNAYMVIEKK